MSPNGQGLMQHLFPEKGDLTTNVPNRRNAPGRWPLCSTSTLKSVIADNNALFTSIKVYDGRQRCFTDSQPWDFCAKSLPQGLNDLSKNLVWRAFCSSFTKFPYPSRNLLVRLTGRDEIAFTRPAREVMWEIMHVSLVFCGIWIFFASIDSSAACQMSPVSACFWDYRVSKEDWTQEMEQRTAPDCMVHTCLCCPLFHFLCSILFTDPVVDSEAMSAFWILMT